MKKSRLFLVLIALMSTYQLATPKVSLACSGGSLLTFEELFTKPDIVVRATVQEIDSSGHNGILKVDFYLKGESRDIYLALAQTNSHLYYYLNYLQLSGSCASEGPTYQTGDICYFYLKRNPDGFVSPFWSNSINYSVDRLQADGTVRGVPELELWYIASKYTKQLPQLPKIKNDLPLSTSLLITTQSDTNYILPVDGNDPQKLDPKAVPILESQWQRGCTSIDGKQGCTAYSRGKYRIATLAEGKLTWDNITLLSDAPADAFSFSLALPQVAIWNDNQIQLYGIVGWFELLGSVEINLPDDYPRGYGTWSLDGTYFTYADLNGVWLWDTTMPKRAPKLIATISNWTIPIPERCSPRGHYLQLLENDLRYNLDILYGTRLPAGVFSPNEQYLLTKRAQESRDGAPEVCRVGDTECGSVPASIRYQLDQMNWISDSDYVYRVCDRIKESACQFGQGNINGRYDHEALRALEVEPTSKDIVKLRDKYVIAIAIDGTERTFDLRGLVDAPITNVAWYPPQYSSPLAKTSQDSLGVPVWSPDGARIAAAANRSTVLIYDSATKKVLQHLEGHVAGVKDVRWHPDGNQLAVTSLDDKVRIWDVAQGTLKATFHIYAAGLGGFDWNYSGSQLYLYWSDGGPFATFEISKGERGPKQNLQFFGRLVRHPIKPYVVAVGLSDRVRIWEDSTSIPAPWKDFQLSTIAGVPESTIRWATCAQWSSDGSILAFGTSSGRVLVMNALSEEKILFADANDSSDRDRFGSAVVLDVIITAGNGAVITVSRDGTLRAISLQTGKAIYTSRLLEKGLVGTSFSPDKKSLALTTGTSELYIIEIPPFP